MAVTVRVRFDRPSPNAADGPTIACTLELTTDDGERAIAALGDLVPGDATNLEWSATPR